MPISNLGNGLRTSGIYKITIGKNFYYGSTQDFETRKYKHLQKLKTNKQHNPYMQSVYNKYGYIDFEIIEYCKIQHLLIREQAYIDKYFNISTCMNLCPTAGRTTGYSPSAETRAKTSAAQKGKKRLTPRESPSEETRQKIRLSLTGRTASEETKAKQSIAQSGRKATDATKQKMSDSRKGIKMSEEAKNKMSASAKLRDPLTRMGYPMTNETKEKIRTANARLSWDDVAEIRSLWENREMTQLAIAEKFGVSPPHISKMCLGLNWVRS